MAFDFILMLTENDRTIADARARLDEALEGGVRHIGFKDVGLPLPELRALATAIREAGGRSYLEVVSLDAESEMASARAAVDLDVDVLAGRHAGRGGHRDHPPPSRALLPVPGPHHRPSQRAGGPRGRHRRLRPRPCGAGTCPRARPSGLPVYRRRAAAHGGRQRGGLQTRDRRGQHRQRRRVEAAATAGAQGFTVGTAALAGAFPAETEGFAGQVRAILAITARARALSTAPRRIALVAHDTRKTHLSAWVTRHAARLAGHRIVCTGGTGRVLAQRFPDLSIDRLQRGGRGGDQQLAAMIATGDSMPSSSSPIPRCPIPGDVDLQALTRLTVIHDTPLALGPSSADLLVAGLLSGRSLRPPDARRILARSPQIVSEITLKSFPARPISAANAGHCQTHGNGGWSFSLSLARRANPP
jgi:methylglyoxal synthase